MCKYFSRFFADFNYNIQINISQEKNLPRTRTRTPDPPLPTPHCSGSQVRIPVKKPSPTTQIKTQTYYDKILLWHFDIRNIHIIPYSTISESARTKDHNIATTSPYLPTKTSLFCSVQNSFRKKQCCR